MFGTYDDTGLDSTICIDSHARYRPYGEVENAVDDMPVHSSSSEVVWEDVDWGDLQSKCRLRNQNRWENVKAAKSTTMFRYPTEADVANVEETLYFPGDVSPQKKKNIRGGPKYKKRTAVVFQVTESKEWVLDTIQYVRLLIMELSLHTGGEYEVFILVEVEDDKEPIFNNPGVFRKILNRQIPNEFQSMSILFNRKLLKQWYPKTKHHETQNKAQPDTYQPLQLLSLARPDLEFFWHMDIDARYTGHHYDYLETISSWSKTQARDLSWEQASQVYMEGVYNTWKNFTLVVERLASKHKIKGSLRTQGIEPVGPDPPSLLGGRWGVNEEADLVTLGPSSILRTQTSSQMGRSRTTQMALKARREEPLPFPR